MQQFSRNTGWNVEKETALGIRVGVWWAVGVSSVVALVGGAGVLAIWAICVFAVGGSLGFSLAAFEHQWLSVWWRKLLILFLIWGIMLFFGWKAWPHDLQSVTIVWPQPNPILAFTPLSREQLNAKAMSDGKPARSRDALPKSSVLKMKSLSRYDQAGSVGGTGTAGATGSAGKTGCIGFSAALGGFCWTGIGNGNCCTIA